MAVTLEALPKGHEFPAIALDLSVEWVAAYVASVEDSSIAALGDFVPPLAVAAFSIRDLLESAGLPAGAVHLGQELAFLRPVRIGERLTANARIASRGERRAWVLMSVELSVDDERSSRVMTGRATVTFPLHPAAVETDAAPTDRGDPPVAPKSRDALHPVVKTLTQDRINRYSLSSGDHNLLHTDPAFAATTRFAGTIAHGMLVLAYLSEMMTAAFGRAWLESGRLKVRFRAPARPGDTVTALGQIAPRGIGVTTCDVECRNQRGEILIAGDAEVKA